MNKAEGDCEVPTRWHELLQPTLKANEVSTLIYRDFLPGALAEDRYHAVPNPAVVGHSLHDIQHALDIQRKGVSAAKVVVTLD